MIRDVIFPGGSLIPEMKGELYLNQLKGSLFEFVFLLAAPGFLGPP
jgi:hypothetical protein